MTNKRVLLASRPAGPVSEANFRIEEAPLPRPADGEVLVRNLWLSLGYNVKGFDAADLAGEAYTQRGVYLHLSFKFDESLFAGSPLTARQPSARSNLAARP